jgi:hypothetical protein
MAKKKEEYKFAKLDTIHNVYEMTEIPEGATHVESETDYSNCYYESDSPSIKLTFYKKEKA